MASIMMTIIVIIVPVVLILQFVILYEINTIREDQKKIREDQTFIFKYALFRHFVSGVDFPDSIPEWARNRGVE